MRNSTKDIKDDLDRGIKGFKTVVALDGEGLLFTSEDRTILGRKLNSSGRFIDLGDFIINKSEILAVIPMDLYLKRREIEGKKKEQEIKSRKPTLQFYPVQFVSQGLSLFLQYEGIPYKIGKAKPSKYNISI